MNVNLVTNFGLLINGGIIKIKDKCIICTIYSPKCQNSLLTLIFRHIIHKTAVKCHLDFFQFPASFFKPDNGNYGD